MTRISNLFSHIENQPQGNVTRLLQKHEKKRNRKSIMEKKVAHNNKNISSRLEVFVNSNSYPPFLFT